MENLDYSISEKGEKDTPLTPTESDRLSERILNMKEKRTFFAYTAEDLATVFDNWSDRPELLESDELRKLGYALQAASLLLRALNRLETQLLEEKFGERRMWPTAGIPFELWPGIGDPYESEQ